MFLKEIELINFKCHSHLKVGFSTSDAKKPTRKATFILGENGTGKSAVLKAIALVTAGSNALADVLGEPDNWVQNGKEYCEIKATLVTAETEERHISLKIGRSQNLREILSSNQETLSQLDAAIKHADRNYFIVAYGAGRRLNTGENRFTSNNITRSRGIQSLFNPEAGLVSLSNWAMDLDYSSDGEELDIVKRALDDFLLENVSFQRIDRQKKQLIFATPDGEIALGQLSDGYQNVAAWVGDMMYNITTSFQNYKDPLMARGVLLIDEVDLHLHPKWQRKLHTFLEEKLPNFQIIVTTHSPLTAQQARENELYALQRAGDTIELVAFVGDPAKMLLHQILMSPVFGLQSDESVVVEQDKERMRELTLKAETSLEEKEEVSSLTAKLSTVPLNIRSNGNMDVEDVQLLKAINDQLKTQLQ